MSAPLPYPNGDSELPFWNTFRIIPKWQLSGYRDGYKVTPFLHWTYTVEKVGATVEQTHDDNDVPF